MNKTILRLAIPNILSNISVPLLGMVDTAMMGRMESAYYLGAIALGSIIFNFIYWGFGFLRMGTTGLTAQAFGKRNQKESIHTLVRALMVAWIAGGLMVLTQMGIAWLGFSLLEGDEEIKVLAKSYFQIRIYAAPATLSLFALHGWFLGIQNARFPMWLTILVNIFNLIFNVVFVFHFDMKSDGVAMGTVVAQYIGLAIGAWMFWTYYRHYLQHLSWQEVWKIKALKRFFSVNRDIFIRTICLVFTFSFFTSKSASIDATTLAANQILLQYFTLMAYGVDGFAFAAESLVGKYFGAENMKDLHVAIRMLFRWGIGLGITFGVIFILFGEPMLFIFTDQIDIIQTAENYMWWQSLIALLGAIAFMWDGIYVGATATEAMRNSMLFATIIIFLPTFYIAFPSLENHALWLAITLFMLARAILLQISARKHIFRFE